MKKRVKILKESSKRLCQISKRTSDSGNSHFLILLLSKNLLSTKSLPINSIAGTFSFLNKPNEKQSDTQQKV